MKSRIDLKIMENGTYWISVRGKPSKEVITVAEACKELNRSRRQIYRYFDEGWLSPEAKVLGEWLIPLKSIAHLRSRKAFPQPLPSRLQFLFPEYDVKKLNAGRDRTIIIARILDRGAFAQVSWLFRRYQRQTIIQFIVEDGHRLLSAKSLRLWSLYFGVSKEQLKRKRSNTVWDGRI